VLLAALACAVAAFSGGPKTGLDLAVRQQSGHALLRLRFATVSVAFDFERECSNSNACAGSLL
jgi:hypothetical protein